MIVSLTDTSSGNNASGKDAIEVSLVGGKAASLMKLYSTPALSSHVPRGFALTVEFFSSWVDAVTSSSEWADAQKQLQNGSNDVATLTELFEKLQNKSANVQLSIQQSKALEQLKLHMKSWPLGGLAAVRSSAPEEDGSGASFAGAFETKLGVTTHTLEQAVRECFSSRYNYRVFSYASVSSSSKVTNTERDNIAFAAVVMEMVDSESAGVAFSVNPLNSDLDELVIDSAWGLGESVVDGSIEVDHFVWDKFKKQIIEKKVGSKRQEKRLRKSSGGVEVKSVDEERQKGDSLSLDQVEELAGLVCLVESTYQMPMDVEWAYTSDNDENSSLKLKLLQARPITTIHRLDDCMITEQGQPRVLYYDFNIASEATTTSPFTYMDLKLYCRMSSVLMGTPEVDYYSSDPRMMLFNSSTRQYMNLSLLFKYWGPDRFEKDSKVLDEYLSSIFASQDCDRKKYRAKSMPKEINLRSTWNIVKQFPMRRMYKYYKKFRANPERSKEEYIKIHKETMDKLKQLEKRGFNKEEGLSAFFEELMETLLPSLFEQMGAIFVILGLFSKLSKGRIEGKTKEEREEYDALCGGFEGDELMEGNIAMYHLARKLPQSVWSEYNHTNFDKLAERIKLNIDGSLSDIPQEFVEEWKRFMENFGRDGQDQMFVSSARYIDRPDFLLAKISHNVGDKIQDPLISLQEQLQKRRVVMALQEARMKQRWYRPFALSSIQKQNAFLDHLMWMRNSPKLLLSNFLGLFHLVLLPVQDELIRKGRLGEHGDIFHLSLDELEMGMKDESFEMMKILEPRKTTYTKALQAKECPMLIDSRCRILKPDPITMYEGKELEPGTLVGFPISPGVATGRVRVIHSPVEQLEWGEILVAVVTDPAWTPLFVGASAIILQVGGVLQHGALCAREYKKPAVSGIEVLTQFKTGDMVTVDGNTGIVKILDQNNV
mmetsp:Transcript_20312/g.40544  ORF Transcript_20312/g.40544 Transcript_20312/m.40544 type:complete len:941 (+) Transcript_20312:96-2918(+)